MFIRITVLFAILAISTACGPSPGQEVASGNESFAKADYVSAAELYQSAIDLEPAQAEPLYNLANTRYRQGVYTETHQLLPQVASLGSQELAGQSYFNQGNAYFQLNDWEAAVESYKESLRLNPDDLEAKYNLELAMRNLDQQDQQQEQEQEENEENQEEQEQDQDQEGQGDQNEPQEDNQEGQENGEQPQDDQQGESENPQNGEQEQEEESPEEPQEQSADGSEPQEDEEARQQNAQPQEGLTPEQARQLLRAVGQNTETLQEQMQLVLPHDGPPPEKDW